jgi:hypothetical protein
MHFQYKYLYVLNRLVLLFPIPDIVPAIKNKINNNTILMGVDRAGFRGGAQGAPGPGPPQIEGPH